MIIAVVHQKNSGTYTALRLLNRRKKTIKRQRIKSLLRLCMLIYPDNVLSETSNEYMTYYNLKTRSHA